MYTVQENYISTKYTKYRMQGYFNIRKIYTSADLTN